MAPEEDAVKGILDPNVVKAGDVVVIRYEGPKGGPGMQEMLYPTSYLKSPVGSGSGRWIHVFRSACGSSQRSVRRPFSLG